MRIDAHQHFWTVARADYGWLTPSVGSIYRDFAPADLAPLLAAAGIDRSVLVQAAPTIAETDFMLSIADETPAVAKVVGWINFEDPAQLKHLERFRKNPKFVGVRPMIQDIPDPEWMHHADLEWAFRAIIDLDLTFDALGFPVHAEPFLRLLQKYPDMRVVIDHCLKPEIRNDGFADWAPGLNRLAQETGAWCKLSGMVTEAADDWTPEKLTPYAAEVLQAFGPDRTMFGSDWPVLNLASDYATWHAIADNWVPDADDKAKIFGANAARFYNIES